MSLNHLFIRNSLAHESSFTCPDGHPIWLWRSEDLGGETDAYLVQNDFIFQLRGAGANISKDILRRSFSARLLAECPVCAELEGQPPVVTGVMANFQNGRCVAVAPMAMSSTAR
jgi:hypothetical protein